MTLPIGTRRVLVTGGGSGIGLSVAESLAKSGARVVVTGRRESVLQAVSSRFPESVVALPGDVTAVDFQEGLLARAASLLGGLDGVVLSAGEVVHEVPGSISESALRSQLELNLVAPLRLCERAIEAVEAGGGVVIVSSTLAVRPVVSSVAYSAAKAGMLAAMRSFAVAGAARRVRFNAVLPGIVDTDMVRDRVSTHGAELRALHPLGRLGMPEDVASAIVHLLGAAWTTGAEFVVDGGLLMRE